MHLHQIGAPAANLAIVALKSGTVNASPGRVVVRNFSDRPQICELAVDLDAKTLMSTTIVLEPRGQTVIPFGPLKQGGSFARASSPTTRWPPTTIAGHSRLPTSPTKRW